MIYEMKDVFVNRILNLKKIKAIGLDMDHTLIRYHVKEFETLTYQLAIKKLVEKGQYPKDILNLKFDIKRVIRGLIIDKINGNLLKVNMFGRIKKAAHGLTEIDHFTIGKYYGSHFIDLNNKNFYSVDTSFGLSHCCLYAQLVDYLDQHPIKINQTPVDYFQLAQDVEKAIDTIHRDGSLKKEVSNNLDRYIIKDPKVAKTLVRYKDQGKQLWVITNSDFHYTKTLLDYAISPYLADKDWSNFFDLVITYAQKPRFFTEDQKFLKIRPESGLMENLNGTLTTGVYQGGNARTIEKDFQLEGDHILYLGDHIFGDILALKKACQWRTALVLEEIAEEITALKNGQSLQVQLDELMSQKTELEFELKTLDDLIKIENKQQKRIDQILLLLEETDQKLQTLLQAYNSFFNPFWGSMMRAGQDPSLLSYQVEKYACIYMPEISSLHDYPTKNYFRPARVLLPHERSILN